MIPGQRLAVPLAAWTAAVAVLLAFTDAALFDMYRAALPFEVQPVVPIQGTVVALLVMVPPAVGPNTLWRLMFRQIAVIRILFAALVMALGGWLDSYGVIAAFTASVAGAAMQVRLDGWNLVSHARRAGHALLALVTMCAVFWAAVDFPDAALVAALAMSAVSLAIGAASSYGLSVVALPAGYDWRNTPDEKHPGGDLCSCPHHNRRRASPGVIFLCADCMDIFTWPPDAVSRALRVKLWIMRHMIVGKFVYLRPTRDVDYCYFCSSSRGGLGRRVDAPRDPPPPDVSSPESPTPDAR